MTLIILHSNDTHGHLTPIPTNTGESLGGYPRRATFIAQQRAAHPQLLLLDAGDFYQGSKFWHAFKGEADISLMNMLHYHAAALGNHDTDGGIDLLAKRLKQANFPVLCANMRFFPPHPLANAWQSYRIITTNGLRVAIFSLLIDELDLFPADFRQAVQRTPVLETARALIPHLRSQAEVVILLSHLGHLGDIALAEAVTGIDLIIGGHTHLPLTEPHWINGTPLVRSIVGTQTMGRLELEVLPDKPVRPVNYQLVPLDDSLPDDFPVAAKLAYWQAKLPPTVVLGRLTTSLDTRSEAKAGGENTAGNFFTDALMAYFGSNIDLAFVHAGTIRGDRLFGPGDFTNHDLSEYHPFDNSPFLMTITALQLKIILERGVSALPVPVGTFLSHAGLSVTVDINRQPQRIDPDHPRLITPGERIISATFHGTPIEFTDETRTFNIAADGYMGRGGAGYFVLKQAYAIHVAEVGMLDILTWYLKTHSPIATPIEGRIVQL